MKFFFNIFFWLSLTVIPSLQSLSRPITTQDVQYYRNKIKSMFDYAYDNYIKYSDGLDELKPITCEGMVTWGNFTLTLVDSLDALIVFDNQTEFQRAVDYVINHMDIDQNINVSVFETNIRIVGGLLSAHLLSYRSDMELEPEWPCQGPLLRLAEKVARKLLPAFDTNTGMPYGTVNLKHGVPQNETPITCTACIGTFILEFATLSRLTGDKIFEDTAFKALHALHKSRSRFDLVGNHINTSSGVWTAVESSVGGSVDSYFEYLVKGSLLLNSPELMHMFKVYYRAIKKFMKRDDWFFMVHMSNGLITLPVFQSLESFFPGLLVRFHATQNFIEEFEMHILASILSGEAKMTPTLLGDIDQAKKSMLNYYYVFKKYGFVPEFFDVASNDIKNNGNPLRPEFSESLYYLYRATKDPIFLSIGMEVVESIEYSAKTDCGYASIKNIIDHTIEDRMESFFLGETLKYLYLLFDNDNFLNQGGSQGIEIDVNGRSCIMDAGGYIFNTEGHPIDVSMIDCCSKKSIIDHVRETVNIYSIFDPVGNYETPKRGSVKLEELSLDQILGFNPESNETLENENSSAETSEQVFQPNDSINEQIFATEVHFDTDDSENILIESHHVMETPSETELNSQQNDPEDHVGILVSTDSIIETSVKEVSIEQTQIEDDPRSPKVTPTSPVLETIVSEASSFTPKLSITSPHHATIFSRIVPSDNRGTCIVSSFKSFIDDFSNKNLKMTKAFNLFKLSFKDVEQIAQSLIGFSKDEKTDSRIIYQFFNPNVSKSDPEMPSLITYDVLHCPQPPFMQRFAKYGQVLPRDYYPPESMK